MKQYSISIIMAAYNEAEILEESVVRIRSFLQDHFDDFEIIIVESGSNDGSDAICDRLAKNNDTVRVIHEESRNGYGSALKLGISQASKDIVCPITADIPFPIETLLDAVPLLARYDCILSYRSIDTRKSLFRKVQSFVYNSLIHVLFKIKVKHVNSAFRIYKRSYLQEFNLISNGWFIETEILFLLSKNSISFSEIPVELIERTGGESSVAFLTPLNILKEAFCFLKYSKSAHRSPWK